MQLIFCGLNKLCNLLKNTIDLFTCLHTYNCMHIMVYKRTKSIIIPGTSMCHFTQIPKRRNTHWHCRLIFNFKMTWLVGKIGMKNTVYYIIFDRVNLLGSCCIWAYWWSLATACLYTLTHTHTPLLKHFNGLPFWHLARNSL